MAPSKPRVTRKKVASSKNPTPKMNKRAGSKRLATPQDQFSDDQTPMDTQQTISQKMDALLRVVTDLTIRVSGFEEKQDKGEPSVMTSQVTPAPIGEIAPDVRRWVAERLRRPMPLNPDTEDTSDEEEYPPPRWGNNLKSGMQRTGASMVIHKVTWPHEVVYTSGAKGPPTLLHSVLLITDVNQFGIYV